MIKQNMFRIIYFKDSRYGNTERYVIVKGSYLHANKMAEWLTKQSGFATEVSHYYTLDNTNVTEKPTGAFLKPNYDAIKHRSYWGGK